eukprot:12714_1
MSHIPNVPMLNGMTMNSDIPPNTLTAMPPRPVISQNPNNLNGTTTVKHTHKKPLSSHSFDIRRVRKIRRLDRKIRSIQSGASKELQREIDKIQKERQLKLEQLKEARASELNDSRQRYNLCMKEISKETTERNKTLQLHLNKELQRIRSKILNSKKKGKDKRNSKHRDGATLTNSEVSGEIDTIFNNWQNEINFNTKIRTRQQTKNKNSFIKYKNGTDLSRIRFHLREDQIKCDLRLLLDKEQCITRKRQTRSSMDFDDDIQNAFHHQPSYVDRHISGITNKLGPLNDPCIDDLLGRRGSRRRNRTERVNYQVNNHAYSHDALSNMYHAQEVHFFTNASFAKSVYANCDSENVEVPGEERGHQVTIASFAVQHGDVVRLNYLGSNTTIDAMVVSIKKNQLSAITLVGKKRKRIWYKELRVGKINIAPATAYR